MSKIVFITGPVRLTEELFKEYYVPKIDAFIKEGASFITSSAIGCDRMACYYLAQKVSPDRLTVYDILDRDHSCIKLDGTTIQFKHVNGFKDYQERDKAMGDIVTDIIAFAFQYVAYGVLENVLCFEEKRLGRRLQAEEVILLMKKHSMEKLWSQDMEDKFINNFE